MLVSILHRITGIGLAIIGGLIFTGWLLAAASGEETYAWVLGLLITESGTINIVGAILGIGLTWAFFTHLFNGMRHFVLDAGAGYELNANRRWSIAVVAGAIVATIALWAWLFWPAIGAMVGGEA